jgi:hypothetical protein
MSRLGTASAGTSHEHHTEAAHLTDHLRTRLNAEAAVEEQSERT